MALWSAWAWQSTPATKLHRRRKKLKSLKSKNTRPPRCSTCVCNVSWYPIHTETYESSFRTRRIRRSDFSYVSLESGILAVQRRELIIEEVHKHFTLQLSSFSRSRSDRRSPPTTARPANADRGHGLIDSEDLVTDRITIPLKSGAWPINNRGTKCTPVGRQYCFPGAWPQCP